MMNQNYIPPAGPPPMIAQRSGNQSAIKIVLGVFAAMIAAVLGLIVLLLIGIETGPVALLIGMFSACLPAPLYVTLLLWIDRYESEPIWMLATAFLWGALVAVFAAFVFNTSAEIIVAASTNSASIAQNFGAVISAPIVEESAKGFILFVFFFWKKDEFDGIIDGIVYAGMVGLGFAMTENIQYYGRSLQSGIGGLTVVFILRGMIGPFSHPLFTSMTGIGLGWARQSDNGFIKVTMPVLGFMLAILMHATWNGSVTFGGLVGFIVAYCVVMAPAFVITLMTIFFALRREGRIVREFLYVDCQTGLLAPQEYEKLCSVRGRMGLSWNALTKRGFATWRVRMKCNQAASELAFHRSRVKRGIVRNPHVAQEREQACQQLLYELQRRLST
jgi:RsiW-degrading membrane proteinase PrsW (M82 family)